jgi:XTP/dITP diphosphohydrolase
MVSVVKKLVLATNNKNKKIEIENLLKNIDVTVLNVEGEFDPEETGETFQENAYIKAFEAAKIMNIPALADDSGLIIDALDGLPGVHSSRFAENDKKRIEKVLNLLQDIKPENKTARFICSMVMVSPNGKILHSCTGICEGFIIEKSVGEHGFGYDPIFYIPELKATMAQLSLEEKNKISHRAKALSCMIDWLKSN